MARTRVHLDGAIGVFLLLSCRSSDVDDSITRSTLPSGAVVVRIASSHGSPPERHVAEDSLFKHGLLTNNRVFSMLSGMQLQASGRITLSERIATSIEAFDSSGKSVFSLGRRGAGPGEFKDLELVSSDDDSSTCGLRSAAVQD